MNSVSSGQILDPGVGRLPPPTHDRALSERQFRRIVDHWRDKGIWVSLWDARGTMEPCPNSVNGYWEAWIGSGAKDPVRNAFMVGLSDCVNRMMADDEKSGLSGSVIHPVYSPAPSDFQLAAVMIRRRKQCIGVVLAVAATSDPGGEDFQRLCGACGLDYRHMLMLRDRHGGPAAPIDMWSSLLGLAVEQAREFDAAQNEIVALTNNLESTYEELHLIYEISRLMGIPQKPTHMLERVGREMLEVSRAAGMAFVLRTSVSDGDEHAKDHADVIAEHVVKVGDGAPSLRDILLVDRAIPEPLKLEADHILYNMASQRPEFQWASHWLRHMVAFPLRLEGALLGMFYAVNVIDDGDYTSVDIQLLKAVADRISAALKNQHLYDDLADLLLGLMHALVNSVDAKDPYTFGHSERVAYYSRAIAQSAGMPEIDCERVYLAGLLHDVGKIGVPDAVLTKPGKLTVEEFDQLKQHPEIGERILAHIRQLRDLIPGVLYHHERMDGNGYPHKLAGQDIPLLGRIICIADSFDAMTSNRTYRAALPVSVAVAEIRRCAGSQFDPSLAELFLALDPKQLFNDAKENTRGDPDIGRIGALCAVLTGRASGARTNM